MLWSMGKTFLISEKIDLTTYVSILKVTIGSGDDYTTDFLLDYSHFNESDKLIALDLNEQQPPNVDPKAIH